MTPFRTTHCLAMHVAPWRNTLKEAVLVALLEQIRVIDDDPYPTIPWRIFSIGTCEGQFRDTPEAIEILSVINGDPGNGHFKDVLEWFYYRAFHNKLPLRILSFTNAPFKHHLIIKHGFKPFGVNDLELPLADIPKGSVNLWKP